MLQLLVRRQDAVRRFGVGLAAILSAAATLFGQSVVLNPSASRVVGHLKLNQQTTSPNLVEGRELLSPQSVAVDTSSSPPILYIADTGNNRVLAFRITPALTKANTADKVIGQRDLVTTLAQIPTQGGLSTGLNFPVSVAVDRGGNLYVADTGNNRVLRYPRPLQQTSDLLVTDLVIGQKTVTSGNTANQGNSLPNEKTLYLSGGGAAYRLTMTFDAQGNLWMADPGNNRVLRFPAGQLTPNTSEPAADLVLGQFTFTTRDLPQGANNTQLNKSALVVPSGLAFDANGRLYVSDAFSRILYFTPPFGSGASAQRVLGVQVQVQGQPPPTFPNATALGGTQNGVSVPPEGIFVVNNNLFVCDPISHRIVRYDPPEQWAAETQQKPSPDMKAVIGQNDLGSGKPNRGQNVPSASGFASPLSIYYTGSELYVVDFGNHRVMALPQTGPVDFGAPARLIGQLDFIYSAPNLIDGREFFIYNGNFAGFANGGTAIAIDRNSSPPRLYIADSLNNRILGFKDARFVRPNDRADLVIGQIDMLRNTVNYPAGDPATPTDLGLFNPVGLAVDPQGNLWVADTGNGRVLRYPSPFNQPSLSGQRPTLVLGQSGFFSKFTDAGVANMRGPYGLALLLDGSLAVSDFAHNRVLVFRRPAGGDFANGQSATVVYGQPDFSTTTPGTADNRLTRPAHIATDTDDRLFVADQGNGRVVIYTRVPSTATTNVTAALTLQGLNSPHGVAVSPRTGELWVTDTFNARMLRYPEFQTLLLNPQQFSAQVQTTSLPIAVGLDAFDNLLVAEASNKISLYFPQLVFQHAATFASRSLTPGMLAFLYRLGIGFDDQTASAVSQNPWPASFNDVQVLVNDVPAPIFNLGLGRIDIQVPMSAPSNGNAEFQVIRPSSGQILAAGTFLMAQAAPGLFTSNSSGQGQLAALNEDGSVNSPSSGAARGSVITLFGTGQGFVPNAPADGAPPSQAAATPVRPRVNINGTFVPDSDILYSGVGAFPGGWQISVKVPATSQPLAANRVVVTLYDIPSNLGPTSAVLVTTIFVK